VLGKVRQFNPLGTRATLFHAVPIASNVFDISSKNLEAGDTLNRIELSGLLMNEYLYAKQDWELERDEMINEATEVCIRQITRRK
jgi:hypothetical protein